MAENVCQCGRQIEELKRKLAEKERTIDALQNLLTSAWEQIRELKVGQRGGPKRYSVWSLFCTNERESWCSTYFYCQGIFLCLTFPNYNLPPSPHLSESSTIHRELNSSPHPGSSTAHGGQSSHLRVTSLSIH